MKQRVLNIAIFFIAVLLCISQVYLFIKINELSKVKIVHTVRSEHPIFFNKSPKDGLIDALNYYDVKHPNIVYAQAVLETGDFTSDLCINHHNLFGLYDSKKLQYYTFNHWTESVEAYVKFVQYKYKPPNDYYEFLNKIGYAEDSTYTEKLKIIVNKIQNDKRRYTERDTISSR
jgi:flagellum-specific peptidoglycan hydrolase FlgJ